MALLDGGLGAYTPRLLLGYGRHLEVPLQLDAELPEDSACHHHRRDGTLHVRCSPSVDDFALDAEGGAVHHPPRVGVDHPASWDVVEVAVQQQAPPATASVEGGHHVVQLVDSDDVEADGSHLLRGYLGDLGLLAGRARRPNQLLQEGDRILLALFYLL